jgi:hypothetical protein
VVIFKAATGGEYYYCNIITQCRRQHGSRIWDKYLQIAIRMNFGAARSAFMGSLQSEGIAKLAIQI